MTQAISQLIDDLERAGIRVWAEQGQLRFRAPQGAMTDERRQALREHKDDIISHLSAGGFPRLTADEASRYEPFPITDVQSAYLLGRGRTFVYGGVACHGYGELRYPSLDPARMTAAWRALIARHDMLRAVVANDGSQRVLPKVDDYVVAVTDTRGTKGFDTAVETTRSEMDHRVFPHDKWPLFEARITLGDDEAVLHLSVDFLIADFISIQIILDELHRLYHQPDTTLPSLDITFRDYLLAERSYVAGGRHDTDRDYWLSRVDSLPPAPELPVTSQAGQSAGRFKRWALTLPRDTWSQLRERAGRHDVSPSTAVLAAYVDAISRWSRHPAFTVNVTLLNRLPLHEQVPLLVGDFTSVELLAVDCTPVTFAERARAAQAQLWQDMDHRTFTGIEVMREIARRKGGDAALFPVVFTSAIGLAGGVEASDIPLGELGYGISQTPQVFIDCQNMERDGMLATNWDVREGVFPDDVIDDMFTAYQDLLLRLATDDTAWTGPLESALPAAQQARRAQANDTAAPFTRGRLHDAFFAQAALTPDRIAVIAGAEEVTYGQLAAHAAGVASWLTANGCGKGDLVAITLERGWHQVSAALGTLLASGAYMPIDTSSPAARQEQIMSSSGARLRLTATTMAAIVPGSPPRDVTGTGPEDLAYVIHTSGSTGTPKGVMIAHEAALNTIADINQRFSVTDNDRVLALSALGFDLSVYDIFGPLSVGGCLVIPDHERRADPSHWAQLVAQHHITVWNSVPAQLQMLSGYLSVPGAPALPGLRLAMLSGDWIPVALPDQIRAQVPGLSIVSLGGATEASIWSISYPIGTVDPTWASIPYGKPLANQTFHVLDAALRPCPEWVVGELYIGGAGVAMGYLNDPQRTQERFITHPTTRERLYRTGDLGRYLADGNIEFLGREDFQVKIRGYRIELAEIETALAAHTGVANAAVLVEGDQPLERRLVAFAEPARITPKVTGLDELPAVASAAGDASIEGVDRERYRTFTDRLDRVALPAMIHALQAGGLFPEPGTSHTLDDILTGAAVSPKHHRLVRRWLRALTHEGLLSHHDGRYSLVAAVQPLDQAWAGVDEVALPTDQALLDYFRASISSLPALLRGDSDPLRLLFPDGKLDVSQTLYEDALFNRWANEAAGAVVRHLTGQFRGPVRILEVGAGGGGTTQSVLSALSDVDYTYLSTDLSPYFLNQSQARFTDNTAVHYAVCDLNADLRAQGLAPNSFDLIIAGDVLHATADVDAVLGRLRDVLAPGGWIVALEMTRDHYQIMTSLELLVSLDAATGDFADDRQGTDSVFLDRIAWEKVFARAGAHAQVCLPDAGTYIGELGMCVLAASFKADRAPLNPAALTAHLRDRLPEHMVPPVIHVLDTLPITSNAKIDRKALLAAIPRQRTVTGVRTEAMSDLEQRLEAMWSEALKVPVGRDGNLFQLGGDSLVAAQLAGRIMEELPEAQGGFFDEILRNLLERPTVAGLAEWLASAEATGSPALATVGAQADVLVPLRSSGSSVPLVLVPAIGGGAEALEAVAEAIDASAPAWTLSPAAFAALPNVDRVAASCAQALEDADVAQVRLLATGPGALIALEIARTLTERGVLVEETVLLAPLGPQAGTPSPAIYAGDLTLIWPADFTSTDLEFWEDICLGDLQVTESTLTAAQLAWPASTSDTETIATLAATVTNR
ncbi:non-ribosomal peptide synthetase [Catelliglobosispora koreensis]|uniref:non-ribosomal peptide synthetase n=1 Tax=Catelliglobosispora koreensis TaxID=129052 RepID=UPI00035CC206|nr:non-ribosomal peptide synthetase [Catelliglobosispora koreensis]